MLALSRSWREWARGADCCACHEPVVEPDVGETPVVKADDEAFERENKAGDYDGEDHVDAGGRVGVVWARQGSGLEGGGHVGTGWEGRGCENADGIGGRGRD